jgi:hypothetical protein
MKRTCLLAAVLFLASLGVALANLEETLTQVNTRYGDPLNKEAVGKATLCTYRFNGANYSVYFIGKVDVCEVISKVDMTAEDGLTMAKGAVTSRSDWERVVGVEKGASVWNSGDKFFACWEPKDDDLNQVTVCNLAFTKWAIAQKDLADSKLVAMFGGMPGDPPAPRAASPSEAAAAKAAAEKLKAEWEARMLAWHQEQAAKGSAYGQLKMGLRYRDGVGVQKDPAKAKSFLEQSSAQGNEAAAAALKTLASK